MNRHDIPNRPGGWTGRLAALILLAALSPLLLLLALIVRAAMGTGPVLFRQTRIGQGGRPFRIVKFRTMSDTEPPRVVPAGRLLRKWKADELPMLWNVVRGEMAWVGPRPDVPGYADCLSGAARGILRLKPGLTCRATLKYRDEEELLARQADPLRFNDEVIWPDKVRMNLEYLEKRSLREDCAILMETVAVLVWKRRK